MAAPRIALEMAREEPLEFAGEATVTVEALGGEPLLSVSPLAMAGTLSYLDGEYHLRSRLSFSTELECSRCLEPFARSFDIPIQLRLHHRVASPHPETKKETAEEEELEQGDLDLFFYSEPVLPFEEIASEQAIMALPMKPLCREDCRGLCPDCGQDLNAGECACDTERIDPRLEGLRVLKKTEVQDA